MLFGCYLMAFYLYFDVLSFFYVLLMFCSVARCASWKMFRIWSLWCAGHQQCSLWHMASTSSTLTRWVMLGKNVDMFYLPLLFLFDFYLFWFYHDFIYILSFFSSNFHPFHAPDVVQASHPKNIAWNLGRDNLKCSVSSHDLCHGLDFRMIFISFWFQYVWISMWFQSMDNI